ncbi:MAG: hypothetical protein LBC19_11995 [Tannerella sp.]|nr:hypothetical protein [Tannerella sp.]
MDTKPTKYKKRIIEISDYIFANPMANRKDVLSRFGKKWQTSTRTLDRLYKEAKKHCETRLKKQQKAKDDVLVEDAKELIKKDISSRDEALMKTTSIMRGVARKIPVKMDGDGNVTEYKIEIPSNLDVLKAVDSLCKMCGWYAPTKQEITGKDGAAIVPNHKHVVIFKDYSAKENDR